MTDSKKCPLCIDHTAFLKALLNNETALPVDLLCQKHLLEEYVMTTKLLNEVVRRFKDLNLLYKAEVEKKRPSTIRDHIKSLFIGSAIKPPVE